MGSGRFLAAALLLSAASATAQAATQPRVQYAEKVALSTSAGHAEFDAYGRRFALSLQSNDRALARLKAEHPKALAGYRLWRGALDGQSGSWTRLTEHGGRVEGAIWDGHDLYVVGSYAEVANYLTAPLAAGPEDTVVFRLSDTTDFLPPGYCATEPSATGLAPNNGLVQYRNLVAELQVVSSGPTQQIEIAMLADSRLQTLVGDSLGQMVASYNIVDGIYAEQLKLLVLPQIMRVLPASDDPFTATDGSALLAQISTYRQGHADLAALGITHLFTGADLDGTAIGIARLRGACSLADAVSLTEGWYGGSTSAALIMAHEIGHNLGAEHDGSGACASVPETFIMAPNLNGSATFSQCSVTAIRAFIATGPSCIAPANYAHVELPQTMAMLNGEVDTAIVVPYDISSTGTRAADNVVLDLRVNSSLVLTAMPSGIVGCTPTTLGIRCDIGSIAAGSTKHLEFTFLPGQQGTFSVLTTVSASNNQNTRNNTQTTDLNIVPSVDVSVAVTTSKQTANFGDDVDITLTVRSLKSHTARDVRVGQYGAGLRGISAEVPAGANCQFDATNPGQTFCTLGDIEGGGTRQIVIHAKASQVGSSLAGTVYLSAANDSDSSNNSAYFMMHVNAVHDVGLEHVTPDVSITYNMPYEFKANLRSYGSQPVDSVRVDLNIAMQDSAALDSITSVTIGGMVCSRLANFHYDCIVGTLAAGEVLPISVKGVATGLGELRFTMTSYASTQDDTSNDRLYDVLVVKYGHDAAVSHSLSQISGVEGVEIQGSFAAWSYGVQSASNAVITVEVPAQLHFSRFYIRNTLTTSCSIVDPQHLRCTYNFSANDSYQLTDYFVVGDAPGAYQARATMVVAGDENPANDSEAWAVNIAAALDVGLRDFTMPAYLFAGRPVTVPLTFYAGSRAMAGANATISTNTSALLDSVTTGAGTCTRLNQWQFSCALGDLPANSEVNVSAVISASTLLGSGSFTVVAGAPGDNVPQDDYHTKSFQVVAESDLTVRVDPASVTGISGRPINLPSILISRTAADPVQPKLRFSLPDGVTITAVSGSLLLCSGIHDVECELAGGVPPVGTVQVDLKVNVVSAMSFTVPVSVTALNDFSAANNSTSFAVTVNAPVLNPPSSGGGTRPAGGGGGGRIEWPVAIVLGLLIVSRRRRLVSDYR